MKLSRVDLEKLAEQQNEHIAKLETELAKAQTERDSFGELLEAEYRKTVDLQAELSRARTHNGELLIELANSVSWETLCDNCNRHYSNGTPKEGYFQFCRQTGKEPTKKDCPPLNQTPKKKGA
jgi:hypothetical protein